MGKPLNTPAPETGLPFVDTHCHVPWTEGKLDKAIPAPATQLAEFRNAGGQFLITSSIDLQSTKEGLSFARVNKNVYFTCGWAPQYVTYTPIDKYKADYIEWTRIIEASTDSILAFGEIGLDFHHAKTLEKRDRQITELDKILEIVVPKGKPIVLHVRNAAQVDIDTHHPDHPYNAPDGTARVVLGLLEKYRVPPTRVLFHCYSGPASMNDELARKGFWFSVPSSAHGIEKWNRVSKTLPLDRLVTETDSPFQHPSSMEPLNMPKNARYAIAAIAQARNLSQVMVAGKVVENARTFFGINR